MKTLVLHIGMAKTGTSTIQNSLGQASAALRERGISCAPWQPFNHSFDFTVMFMDEPKKSFLYKQLSPIDDGAWADRLHQLREKWRGLFEQVVDGTCIVSAENLPRLSASEIQQLQEFAAPYFDRLRAIVYVRDPLKAIRSQWEQDVKELREPMSGEEVLQRTKIRMGYRFLERWATCLGRENLTVRKFDPAAFHNGSLLDDFFHALGLQGLTEDVVEEVESNQSLGPEGAAFLLALNGRYPQYKDGAYNPQRGLARRLHLFYRAMRKASSGPLALDLHFDEEEAARFNRKVQVINQYLDDADGFAPVEPSPEETRLPGASAIDTDYYVELVNELSLLVEHFADRADQLAAENGHLQAQLASIRDEGDAEEEQ